MTRQERHPTFDMASRLLQDLRDRSEEIEAARRLPTDLAARMAQAGLFRIVTPSAYGGYQCSPGEIVDLVAMISEANASAGWCVMIGATTAMNAAYLPPELAQEIYGNPETITGGVFAPMGKAISDGENYIVTGRWQWGSGSANCSWLCGGAVIIEDGEMRRLESGRPDARMMIFPARDAELIDTWHVMGLQGTGSGDIAVSNLRVPKARSVSLVTDSPKVEGALYTFPAFGLLALGVAAAAMGNAAGALDDFAELAGAKKPQGSMRTLSERQTVQADFSRLSAAHRASSAYLRDEIEQTWDMAKSDGRISIERRGALRMACTHMVRTSADICRALYDLGGGAALFLSSPLQRRFRDAHAMTQHIVTAPSSWELTGRLMLGLETDAGML